MTRRVSLSIGAFALLSALPAYAHHPGEYLEHGRRGSDQHHLGVDA